MPAKSHGKSNTRTYGVYRSMINRCHLDSVKCYPRYGGRGITVCDRWRKSFAAFLEDMGECPEGHSIDRADNDGPYSPDNCRWATMKEQNRNRRDVALYEHDGKLLSAADLAAIASVPYATMYRRLTVAKMSPAEAIERPHQWHPKHKVKRGTITAPP